MGRPVEPWPGRALLLVACCLAGGLFAPVAQADSSEAREALNAGVSSFRDGQLRRARGFFLEALNAGLHSSRLYYNLGVVHYRLGEFEEADAFFRHALAYPASRQLAQYNLARCAQKLRRSEEALSWYAQAAQGEDLRVAELARRARDLLLAERQEHRRLLVSVRAGFDSAVVGLVDQVTSSPTDNSDLFSELTAQWLWRHDSAWLGPGQWDLAGFALNYDDQEQVNVQSVQIGWSSQQPQRGQRRWALRVQLAHEWLDGQRYQLRLGPELEFSHAWRGQLLRHALEVEFLRGQEELARGIEGLRVDLSSTLLRKQFGGVVLARVGLQLNEREAQENSPTRYLTEMFWRSPKQGSWQIGPGLQWRLSDSAGNRAREDRWRAVLRLDTPLTGPADARIELQYEENDSADARLRYAHFRVSFGVSWAL